MVVERTGPWPAHATAVRWEANLAKEHWRGRLDKAYRGLSALLPSGAGSNPERQAQRCALGFAYVGRDRVKVGRQQLSLDIQTLSDVE